LLFTGSFSFALIARSWPGSNGPVESPLWADGTVRVEPAASKETVAHHILGKQKNSDCQDDYKKQSDNSEPGKPALCGAQPVRITRHHD
jgi:hypothetical protein